MLTPDLSLKTSMPRKKTPSIRRLFRRTDKALRSIFKIKQAHGKIMTLRNPITDEELTEWTKRTFLRLFAQHRYDRKKISSQEELLQLGLQLNVKVKNKLIKIEALLEEVHIDETHISRKDVWLFSLYQTLRKMEHDLCHGEHIYTSSAGRLNSEAMISRLNQHIPGWIDANGKIRKI